MIPFSKIIFVGIFYFILIETGKEAERRADDMQQNGPKGAWAGLEFGLLW